LPVGGVSINRQGGIDIDPVFFSTCIPLSRPTRFTAPDCPAVDPDADRPAESGHSVLGNEGRPDAILLMTLSDIHCSP
jgi:hypothetical protein